MTIDHDGASFWSYSYDAVSLNVDDFREIEAIVEKLGLTVNRTVGTWAGPGEASDGTRDTSTDIGTANPLLVGATTITAFDPSEGSAGGQLTIQLTPIALSVQAESGPSTRAADLRQAVQSVARVMRGGRGRLHPRMAAEISNILFTLVLIAIWAWVVAASQSLPTSVVALGVFLLAMRGYTTRLRAFERWWQHRGLATWLDPKSRAELATERAGARRDLKVGLLSAVCGAAVGVIFTAIVQWRISQ